MSRNVQMRAAQTQGWKSAQKLGLASGASLIALVIGATAAGSAQAQTAPASVEEVVVTGTRVVRDGYQAPTPLTVISETEILAAAPPTSPTSSTTSLPSSAVLRRRPPTPRSAPARRASTP
jgi:hypothetical protein